MRIRDTEKGRIIELVAVDSNGINFLQDFFEGGKLFNGTYNDDANCYDTDSNGFENALFSFKEYITEDWENAKDDQWIASEKWIGDIAELSCYDYTLSLDNGCNWKTVDELTDEEISFLINDEIPAFQESENSAINEKYACQEYCRYRCSADNATGNTDREWLKSFVKYLKDHYNEKILIG